MKKTIIKYALIGIGVLLLIYALVMAFFLNFNLGIIAVGLCSIAIIIYALLMGKQKKMYWLHSVFISFFTIIITFSSFLAFYGNRDNAQYSEDVVIILGAGIHGEKVSVNLANRLDKASQYYEKNSRAIFLVSGGQGKQEDISEALAMERYLIDKGIPLEQIVKEEKSTSTYENFLLSVQKLENIFTDDYSVVFITNNYHVYRAEKISQSLGISARHIGAETAWYNILINYTREMMAVSKEWLKLLF